MLEELFALCPGLRASTDLQDEAEKPPAPAIASVESDESSARSLLGIFGVDDSESGLGGERGALLQRELARKLLDRLHDDDLLTRSKVTISSMHMCPSDSCT